MNTPQVKRGKPHFFSLKGKVMSLVMKELRQNRLLYEHCVRVLFGSVVLDNTGGLIGLAPSRRLHWFPTLEDPCPVSSLPSYRAVARRIVTTEFVRTWYVEDQKVKAACKEAQIDRVDVPFWRRGSVLKEKVPSTASSVCGKVKQQKPVYRFLNPRREDTWLGGQITRSQAFEWSRYSRAPLDRRAISRACCGSPYLVRNPYLRNSELPLYSPACQVRIKKIELRFGLSDLRDCVHRLNAAMDWLLAGKSRGPVVHRRTAYLFSHPERFWRAESWTDARKTFSLLPRPPDGFQYLTVFKRSAKKAWSGLVPRPASRRLRFQLQYPLTVRNPECDLFLEPHWRTSKMEWRPAYTLWRIGSEHRFYPRCREWNAALELVRSAPTTTTYSAAIGLLRSLESAR